MAFWFFAHRIFPVALTSLQCPGPGQADRVRRGAKCRSQPAGDGLKCAAFIQLTSVIVNDHRWQASSHKGTCPLGKTVGASLLAMDSSAPRLSSSPALSLTTIAGKPAPTGDRAHAETVGAILLAMDSSALRLSRSPAFSLTTIAGKPAPTGDRVRVQTSESTDQSVGNCPMRPIISVTICKSNRNCSVVLNSLSL